MHFCPSFSCPSFSCPAFSVAPRIYFTPETDGLYCAVERDPLVSNYDHHVTLGWSEFIGDYNAVDTDSRAFPVARARIWNTLPLHVTSASSLTVFKLHLKLDLFCFSFPGLSPLWLLSGPCSVCCTYATKFFWLIDWFTLCWKTGSQSRQNFKVDHESTSGAACSIRPPKMPPAPAYGDLIIHPEMSAWRSLRTLNAGRLRAPSVPSFKFVDLPAPNYMDDFR